MSKEVIGNQSIKSVEIISTNSRIITLNESNINKIKGLSHVVKLGTLYTFAGSATYNSGEIDTVVYGINENYAELSNLIVSSGRQINESDTETILANQALAKSLNINNANELLGKKIAVYIPAVVDSLPVTIQKEFTVVGIVDSGSGAEIFLPSIVFDAAKAPAFSHVRVMIDDTNNVADTRQQIESLGFETSSPADTIEQINQIFKFFNLILVSFGAIGMIVAVLGMFNTLTISLLERTKEIGLMVALGARSRDMKKLFTLEAVILSFAGAVIGITLSVMAGFILNIIMNSFARNRGVTTSFSLFSTPWWLVLGMIGFMIGVGLLVVFIPARRAEHINPIDALRRE